MSSRDYVYRFIVTNVLTVYYTFLMLVVFAFNYVKNPFYSPWTQKLRLEPPAPLKDPKYGVHKYLKVNECCRLCFKNIADHVETIQNTKLHYVESGDPTKPLMIFLHGFPEFWYSWRYQILDFKKDYWCIAVDMRGYGDSERPEGVAAYKIELLVEDVRDLIRQLGREKCILVSHDWGGLIACRFRDVHPDVLNAVVLLASASREAWTNEVWTNPAQRKMSWYVFLHRMPSIPERFLLMNDLAVYELMMLVPGKNTTDKLDIECYKYWFGKPYAFTPPINYYRANYSYIMPSKYHDENVPMLVAHGSNDEYLKHGILDTMKKDYAHIETTLIENTGHFMQQEEPEKVNKLIRAFLSKHNL